MILPAVAPRSRAVNSSAHAGAASTHSTTISDKSLRNVNILLSEKVSSIIIDTIPISQEVYLAI